MKRQTKATIAAAALALATAFPAFAQDAAVDEALLESVMADMNAIEADTTGVENLSTEQLAELQAMLSASGDSVEQARSAEAFVAEHQ